MPSFGTAEDPSTSSSGIPSAVSIFGLVDRMWCTRMFAKQWVVSVDSFAVVNCRVFLHPVVAHVFDIDQVVAQKTRERIEPLAAIGSANFASNIHPRTKPAANFALAGQASNIVFDKIP